MILEKTCRKSTNLFQNLNNIFDVTSRNQIQYERKRFLAHFRIRSSQDTQNVHHQFLFKEENK